jgi:succinate-semialdehyde dehydrogenase/glutarate-semialdehyde dehydrogenase
MWNEPERAAAQKQRSIHNPSTGEEIGVLKENTVQELCAAVDAARKAQKEWATVSVKQRARHIRCMRDFIAAHADPLSDVVSKSTGKTRVDALSAEVLPSALAASYYARIAPRVHAPRKLERGSILFFNKSSYTTRVPFGVIGIISPWNYPFSIPFHEVVMGLLSGNGVILKVATQTQLVGEAIADVVKAGGLPEGLFRLVHLPGPAAGDAMLQAGVNKLFFTGSTAVGRELMAKAAKHLVPVVLELGGNDAMIVLDDAHAERAAGGAIWAGLSNAGQSCAGVERIYVCPKIYDSFVTALTRQVSALRVGPDMAFDVDIGSITQEQQKQKVQALVRDALSEGATVTCRRDAPDRDGAIYHPVLVLENVNGSMRIMREEVFGPVLAIQKVRDEEEAIARANASEFGLTASVWSRRTRHARAVAERLEAGAVTLNDHLMSHGMAETPWGGFKNSGIGRSHGEIGFLEMTQPRVIISDMMHSMPRNMWWHPHNQRVYTGLKAALDVLYGRGLFKRVASVFRVVKLFMRSFTRG